MEGVLARQNERPHRLRQAQLNVRIFTDSIEDYSDDILDGVSGVEATADKCHSTSLNLIPRDPGNEVDTSLSQRPEPKAQQLHMAVDPDVMEYVTTTSLHEQFKVALAAKKIEINWRLNSKTAVLLYRGEDKSDSWQSECIAEVQAWLGKLKKQDFEVKKDFWEAVKAQLPGISACLGVEPPLVKMIDDSFLVRTVSLKPDAKDLKENLKAKLKEIYRQETRKTYLEKKEKVLAKHLTLLKSVRFVEKLREKNTELEIKLDTKAEGIYFKGPQLHVLEATTKFHEAISGIVEKKLNLSKNILKALSSDEGLKKVNDELERNKIEAVVLIDNEPRIVGTSAVHADKAFSTISELTSEEKVPVKGNSRHLVKTTQWHQLRQKLDKLPAIRVLWNNQEETLVVTGFRKDIPGVVETLTSFLDNNSREEQYKCPSTLVRKYFTELRQDDLRSIEVQLQHDYIKIETGESGEDFVLRGNKDGILLAKVKLELLARGVESQSFNVKQPGLKKYFASGNGDRLVASVEKNHACVIHVQKQDDMRTPVKDATAKFDVSNNEDDDDDEECDDDGSRKKKEDKENPVSSSDCSFLVTQSGHTISWRRGSIQTQKVICNQSYDGRVFFWLVDGLKLVRHLDSSSTS